jgi:hypothetical protein
MSVPDKVWDTFTTAIKMNDKIVLLAGTVKEQQSKIERLTERLVQLETTLESVARGAAPQIKG